MEGMSLSIKAMIVSKFLLYLVHKIFYVSCLMNFERLFSLSLTIEFTYDNCDTENVRIEFLLGLISL